MSKNEDWKANELTPQEAFVCGVFRGESGYEKEMMIPDEKMRSISRSLFWGWYWTKRMESLVNILDSKAVHQLMQKQELLTQFDLGSASGRLLGRAAYLILDVGTKADMARRAWDLCHAQSQIMKKYGRKDIFMFQALASTHYSLLSYCGTEADWVGEAGGITTIFASFDDKKFTKCLPNIVKRINEIKKDPSLVSEIAQSIIMFVSVLAKRFRTTEDQGPSPLARLGFDERVQECIEADPNLKKTLIEAQESMGLNNFTAAARALSPAIEVAVERRFKQARIKAIKTETLADKIKLLGASSDSQCREFAQLADVCRLIRNRDQHEMESSTKIEAQFMFSAVCLLISTAYR
ncbi:MAG: hypothetical protein HY291_20710 [Planctomycetes bacterium]|nr:hypothetical protein [Planctomycetota bacterium]